MRARLALRLSGLQIVLREILLKDKPSEMLQLSPKGTVPVLHLDNGQVLDESIDIAYWALEQNDPQGYLPRDNSQKTITNQWLSGCDEQFKHWLDRYKYADRHPEHSEKYYREQGESFLQALEAVLVQHSFLLGEKASLADIAVFPFIRQFAHVDKNWFDQCKYISVRRWLEHHLNSELFQSIMLKVPVWSPDQEIRYL